MLAVDIDASPTFHASALRTLFTAPAGFLTASAQYAHGWDVSPDGERFLTTYPPDTSSPAITVVINWESSLIK
jgi:hypothetical protein